MLPSFASGLRQAAARLGVSLLLARIPAKASEHLTASSRVSGCAGYLSRGGGPPSACSHHHTPERVVLVGNVCDENRCKRARHENLGRHDPLSPSSQSEHDAASTEPQGKWRAVMKRNIDRRKGPCLLTHETCANTHVTLVRCTYATKASKAWSGR